MDPEALAAAFRERPALHRFPGAMAERVRALCAFIEERYDGDAARIWREAASGEDLRARLGELPGFGEMKVRTVMTLLARQFGVQPPGIEALLPDHPTLGDVRTAEELAAYQAHKRVAEGRTARGGSRPAVRRSVFDYFRALDGLADEEREIHATVRAFVDEAIVPNVQGWWDGDTLPRELITQMGELGILGPTTPAEYGGSGISSTAYGLICYELERGDSGVRSSASVQGSLVMYPIYAYGSEEQKRTYLPELASGTIVGCFGLTESDGGSDPGAMRTRARRDGDDYVLNGSKMWITNSPLADVAVVWAKDDDDVIQGFLVESDCDRLQRPGHAQQGEPAREHHRRDRARGRARAGRRRASPSTAGSSTRSAASPRPATASPGARSARSRRASPRRSSTRRRARRSGARSPPGSSSSRSSRRSPTQHSLGLLMARRLGQLKDAGEMNFAQVSMAKRNNVRVALEGARLAREMHGGNGITTEYPVIRHMLNLETVDTYEGTHDIHTLIVGRDLTGENALG